MEIVNYYMLEMARVALGYDLEIDVPMFILNREKVTKEQKL